METKAAQTKGKHHLLLISHSKNHAFHCIKLVAQLLHFAGEFIYSVFLTVTLTVLLLCFASPSYNITVTQVIVGEEIHDLEFSAIFDSGTSFTYLNDPAYTLISKTVS